jgi:hypothetical protein
MCGLVKILRRLDRGGALGGFQVIVLHGNHGRRTKNVACQAKVNFPLEIVKCADINPAFAPRYELAAANAQQNRPTMNTWARARNSQSRSRDDGFGADEFTGDGDDGDNDPGISPSAFLNSSEF